jgi:hypothetical protein
VVRAFPRYPVRVAAAGAVAAALISYAVAPISLTLQHPAAIIVPIYRWGPLEAAGHWRGLAHRVAHRYPPPPPPGARWEPAQHEDSAAEEEPRTLSREAGS